MVDAAAVKLIHREYAKPVHDLSPANLSQFPFLRPTRPLDSENEELRYYTRRIWAIHRNTGMRRELTYKTDFLVFFCRRSAHPHLQQSRSEAPAYLSATRTSRLRIVLESSSHESISVNEPSLSSSESRSSAIICGARPPPLLPHPPNFPLPHALSRRPHTYPHRILPNSRRMCLRSGPRDLKRTSSVPRRPHLFDTRVPACSHERRVPRVSSVYGLA
ncbi:hypothetical protein C8R44DRAFT_989871 [Mycena epipterygia]|nr:hypothetical protein C8R44DRAFT_989871 [Mycena epipterygia]